MKKSVLMILMGTNICAMEEIKRYHAPALANKVLRETTEQDLLKMSPEHLLKDEGVIEALVIRPEKDWRVPMSMVEVTPTHILGDKNAECTELQDLAAVTMTRADVSQAMGGCYLSGDNIHVRGMRMGKQALDVGDILTVIDAQNKVKAIFLKTHIPHQACWKFQSRCGKLAFDFCNNEDAYENGLEAPQGKLNGVEQRARGIRLAVLKAGLLSVGNRVIIERSDAKAKRLAEFDLAQKAAELVAKSKEPGLKYEKEDEARAKMRKDARLKKQQKQDTP